MVVAFDQARSYFRWTDGKRSVEDHLSLYVDDLLQLTMVSAPPQLAPPTSATTNGAAAAAGNKNAKPNAAQETKKPSASAGKEEKAAAAPTSASASASGAASEVKLAMVPPPPPLTIHRSQDHTLRLYDVLDGINYLLLTRIHDSLPRLSAGLCQRLCVALLYHMQETGA